MAGKTQLTIEDMEGKNHLKVFVDWENRHGVPTLKAEMGDARAVLNAHDFWSVAFAIASDEEQEKMLITREAATRCFDKMVKIKATKNIQKGDEIVVRVNFTVPEDVLLKLNEDILKKRQESATTNDKLTP